VFEGRVGTRVNVSLVMVTSDGKARDIPLGKLPVHIGRGEDCKVRVPLPSVSRKHCELLIEDEEFTVKDLNSSNGTYVNGERVRSRELVPGDLLALGPCVFVVRIDGHPKEIDPLESYAAGAVAVGGSTEGASDRRTQMIEGVPTWSGQAGMDRAAKGAAGAEGAEGGSKPGAPDDEKDDADDKDFLGSLLDDFDFGEEEEEEKKK
jgi:predicted component of type VI protein secretion system